MDVLLTNALVVTMNQDDEVLKNACVGVTDGKISFVGGKPPAEKPARVINAAGRVLMPGLCNAHTHIAMTLLRGYADDRSLQDWLFNYIFPAEDKLTEEMVYWGSALGIMEMIASGTVSFSDMYFLVPQTAKAVAESGIKANLSRPVQCFEAEYDYTTDFRYGEAEALCREWHGYDGGRILVDAAVHAEYTSHPKVWEAAAELAGRLGLRMHVHLSETQTEHEQCIGRYQMTPAAVFDKYGLFSVPVTAAHCVWLTDADMALLAQRGATAVLNPVSNLKLGSGVADPLAMGRHGLHTALGTDGAASNNSLDMFEEIKLAALLYKKGEESLKAQGAIHMAVRGGACAQGRCHETGEISAGRDADLILLDFDRPALTPCHDVVSHLAYSTRGSDVVLTMVRGKILYQDGEFTTLDRERILHEARVAASIFSR